MALQTLCDNCESSWAVDQLVYVELVKKNLCPVCINQLVDLCALELTESRLQGIMEELEE